jgi:hypothetical protein
MRRNLLVSVVLVWSVVGAVPASASAGWVVDLGAPGAGSTNVVTDNGVRLGTGANRSASAGSEARTGFAVYPHRLATPANSFAAEVRSVVPAGAELAIDVRGRMPADGGRTDTGQEVGGERQSDSSGSGQWTEWVEVRPGAPGVLPVAVADLEVRVMLSAPDGVGSPTLTELSVVPANVAGGHGMTRSEDGAGASYAVFATREGLVGGTTANGHRIVARDHFVALPSRRGLAGRDGGEYSVRVCAANGRCAWAPVWDVGPWNTRDDYWAGPGIRQEWHDLPQGKPASQAAYQDGYNGGRDQFGRRVANPAGIDLADGTFWDGLKLSNNAWVTVTYQWVGANPVGYVRTPGDTLNVRNAPNSQAAIVGLAGNRAQVRVECAVAGEQVGGTQGTTSAWYRLAPGMYVSAAYVSGGGAAPGC